MILLAADLDRTLIYSAAAAALGPPAGELVPVEWRDGRAVSFVTAPAAALIAQLPLVPVTTRTLAQYERVRLPGPPARYAIAGNGGHLLVDGVPDLDWAELVAKQLADLTPLSVAVERLGQVVPDVRSADDLFCYAVLGAAALAVADRARLDEWGRVNGWTVSRQGRKVYLVPQPLTKAAAVAELAVRTDATAVYAAGDSLLDRELLEYADAGVHPGHGELAETRWRAGHVTRLVETGLPAGERIVRWFADRPGLPW